MDEEEPTTWEVKQVLDKRRNDVTGGIEYYIEWKNWDGPPTWEPEENCDCAALIKRFEREQAKRDSQPPSRSRSHSRATSAATTTTNTTDHDLNQPTTSVDKTFPRAKTPDHSKECCQSPCKELQPPLTSNEYEAEMRKRKLVLKDIIGAVNSNEILLIVKWHGIASLEKVPLQVLRRFHCQDILDFLLEKIKWK